MDDLLFREEIDTLMRELASGGVGKTDDGPRHIVKEYDFKTANRFTKEQIRAINMVFKRFGYLLSNYLTGTLRTSCDAEVLSLEEESFNQFNNSVPSPVIVSIVNATPFNGPILLEMTKEIAYSIISRVLGGTKEICSEGRQFTEIELAVIERVLWQVLRHMDEAWARVIDVTSVLDKLETSMQFAQIVDLNESVLVVTMKITIGEEQGLLVFCLPHQALEPLIKKLSARVLFAGSASHHVVPNPDQMRHSMMGTELVVSASFRPTEANIRDIVSLHVGDVIQLRHRVDEPVIVKYHNVSKLYASLGRYKNNLAVKVVDVIGGDEEHE